MHNCKNFIKQNKSTLIAKNKEKTNKLDFTHKGTRDTKIIPMLRTTALALAECVTVPFSIAWVTPCQRTFPKLPNFPKHFYQTPKLNKTQINKIHSFHHNSPVDGILQRGRFLLPLYTCSLPRKFTFDREFRFYISLG